jgi:hypothetical protein
MVRGEMLIEKRMEVTLLRISSPVSWLRCHCICDTGEGGHKFSASSYVIIVNLTKFCLTQS